MSHGYAGALACLPTPPVVREKRSGWFRPVLITDHKGTLYHSADSACVVCSCGWWTGSYGAGGAYERAGLANVAWSSWDKHTSYPYTPKPKCRRCHTRFAWINSYCAQCRFRWCRDA